MNGCELQVDVSVAQGPNLDFSRMARAGAARAVVRIYNGNDGPDPLGLSNVTRAKQAGLEVEGYCACFPLPPKAGKPNRGPEEQCALFIAEALRLGIESEILWLDAEWPPISDDGHVDDLQHWEQSPMGVFQWYEAAVAYIESQNICAGIYVSPYYATAIGLGASQTLGSCPLWIANYGVSAPTVPAPWPDWLSWQHTSKGTLDGCPTLIDLSYRRV